MGSDDTAGITDTQGLFFYNLSPLPPIMVPFLSHPCNSRQPIQKCDFRKDGKSCPNSWYTIKSILLAPLDLRWCKCLEKIFVLAIFSDVMFAICSSNLGCCTNWSNIMVLNMTIENFGKFWRTWPTWHIWLKVMFLHGMGSGSCLSYTGLVLPEHTSPDSDLVFLSEPQVIFWFSKPVTDDI